MRFLKTWLEDHKTPSGHIDAEKVSRLRSTERSIINISKIELKHNLDEEAKVDELLTQ